ncbi:hypothetical protein DC366_01180 [Pelagivirga sediminicola]|uniref:Uncharacterized protein n=1 Tax=Pelagivirga sediminicola TaxID=2170575 RepID=A0A2T7GB24_9RHOB|nr:hypothetical protein [Pelagivirga sediminicola]PVA11609.1 hypothetical protein DC366_01180 [Pelagivirga sediminicola]
MQWAVLSGDIVDSSAMTAEALDAVIQDLQDISQECTLWGNTGGSEILTGFARRGGDGWQIAVNRPALALRLALYIKARLRRMSPDYSTRLAAATGAGELPTSASPETPGNAPFADLNSAHGAAFMSSGRLLETLSGDTLMAHAGGGALHGAFRLADHVSQGWTQSQARSLCHMLPPGAGPRRVAAERIGISRQAVDQALGSAGYPAIMDAIEAIEEAR